MQARSTRTTALELGITFWDAANVYGFGTSGEIVGKRSRSTPARGHR
ncbi:MAG: aldo/keto reductase, partial [Pseudonocardia sp.]|nr:aldo/keto reductase [Pseudonocardia sp.]